MCIFWYKVYVFYKLQQYRVSQSQWKFRWCCCCCLVLIVGLKIYPWRFIMAENQRSSLSMFVEDSRRFSPSSNQFYTASVRTQNPLQPVEAQETQLWKLSPVRPLWFHQNGESQVNAVSYPPEDQFLRGQRRESREIVHRIVREDTGEEIQPNSNLGWQSGVPVRPSRSVRSQSVAVQVQPRWNRSACSEPRQFMVENDQRSKNSRTSGVSSINFILKAPNNGCRYPMPMQLRQRYSPGVQPNLQNGGGCDGANGIRDVGLRTNENGIDFRRSPEGFQSRLKIQVKPGWRYFAERWGLRSSSAGSKNTERVQQLVRSHQELKMAGVGDRSIGFEYFEEMKQKLLATQVEQQSKLLDALKTEQRRYVQLLSEYQMIRKRCKPSHQEMERLKNENNLLELECDLMIKLKDMIDDKVPLGETSEDFYEQINPGQGVSSEAWNHRSQTTPPTPPSAPPAEEQGRWPSGSLRNKPQPPPRPPPPRFLSLGFSNLDPSSDEAQTNSMPWACSMCTFRNHPDLNKCEQCEMTRFAPSPRPSLIANSPVGWNTNSRE